jgi:ligand-binding sensor domain-containing protein
MRLFSLSQRVSRCVRVALAWVAGGTLALSQDLLGAEPEYLVDAWQTEDGLPQNTVKTILQTRDGYLWFGTFDGLVRFDGIQFTVFTLAKTPGLRSSDINCLFEDREGRLWVGTDGEGLVCYENGAFGLGPGNNPARALKVTSIVQTSEGQMLIATTTGLFRLTDEGWKSMTPPQADFTEPTLDSYLAQNAAGDTWFAHRDKLYRLTPGALELCRTFGTPIGALTVDVNGTVLCGINDGRLAEVSGVGEPRYTDFDGAVWHSIRRIRNGDLWMATRKGLYRVRDSNRLHLTTSEGLVTNDTGAVYEDREGNLWFGTNGGGLHRLRERMWKVHSTKNGLASDDAVSIFQDRDSRIWVGTFKGGANVFTAGQWAPFLLPTEPLVESNITALCQTKDGSIWLGGHFHPHYRWSNGQLERVAIAGFESLRVFFEDRDGGLWIGSRDAGVEYRKEGQTNRYDTAKGLSRNDITAIAQDSDGLIWIGTPQGLNRISPDGITVFLRKDGVGADGIYALRQDKDGALWIGTSGGGLSRFQNGRFATITTDQGLLSDVIGQIQEDDAGFLWMGTTAGIARVRKQDLHDALDGRTRFVSCRSFGKRDGLLQSECANGFQPSCLKDRDGKLWFCTIGGVAVIDPQRIPRTEVPPTVQIDRLILDDETVTPRRSPGTRAGLEQVPVPPGTARLELHFAGVNLIAPDEVRFRYRLEGYDTDWLQAGSRRVAHYTHVPPGHYQFRVTAANNDGVWNETEAVVPLWIKPRFTQTLWFRVLAFLATAGPIGGVAWLRFSHARRVQALRLRIAHDLHDEAGSNLGSIQLLSRRAGKRLQRQENPAPELAEIQRISALTAESVRDVVWLITPEFDTLAQMLKGMESVTGRLLPDVPCDIRSQVTRADRALSLEFRTHFFLMFKEILHNISKHAQATRVAIEMTEDLGHLILSVRDNGIGFEPGTTAQGHGLHSLNHRASQLGGVVRIESRPGQGTVVVVRAKLT